MKISRESLAGADSLTGWRNGDFNYDGIIDGSDYTLIDNAFNLQGGNLSSTNQIAGSTAQIAGIGTAVDFGELSRAVPEPASLSLLMTGMAGFGGRRRRR